MIAKLPRWAFYGGIVLAFIAGMINAAGYLGFRHQAITHMTGTTSLFGIAIGHAYTVYRQRHHPHAAH